MSRLKRLIARLDLASVLYFGLNALLWYARPSDLKWLIGSFALTGAWTMWFMWYLTRDQPHRLQLPIAPPTETSPVIFEQIAACAARDRKTFEAPQFNAVTSVEAIRAGAIH